MSSTKQNHRSIASLKLPKPVSLLITYAQGIVTSMTGNPSFPSPNPPLSAVSSAVLDLGTAETAALKRAKGAATLRNEKRTTLVGLLEQIRAYVQSVADLNVENGASIIQSAGLAVRKSPTRAAPSFHVKQGAVSGEAKVVAPSAGHRSSYEWEYSTDGGKTWIAMPPTIQAKATLDGLTPGSTVQFRYRAVTKTGAGDWSQAAALLVK
jgi:hypothetical protein